MKKKIVVLVGNPVATSFSVACADAYEKVAKKNGAEVRRFNIADMEFDPVLHQGYEVIQELEPDLVRFQESVKWADHLVFIYPNWWSTMPAKMKGVFDRSFLPQVTFKMEGSKFVGLLQGKSGRIINIVGSMHPLLARVVLGDCTNELRNGILRACGVSPVQVQCFGPTRRQSQEKMQCWLREVEQMAEKDTV